MSGCYIRCKFKTKKVHINIYQHAVSIKETYYLIGSQMGEPIYKDAITRDNSLHLMINIKISRGQIIYSSFIRDLKLHIC